MPESIWPLDHLFTVPETYPASEFATPDVSALYFDGMPYQGKPTRVFAYYSPPSVPVDGLAPGIVLVHGGGGTAFADWVRLWNARGYAAIAMDLNGSVPTGEYNKWDRHEWGGPSGISFPGTGAFEQIDQPITDQWYYHGVSAVIRAHSLLRSMPGVDPARIGVTGISWGGYTTCIAIGLDHRFKFAVPVYGCGFIEEHSFWEPEFAKMTPQNRTKWATLWDPKQYLPDATLPILWVTGTNDFAYPLPSLQRSYNAAPGPQTRCIRIRMPHGHGGAGENPLEIRVFADSIVKSGAPLLSVISSEQSDNSIATTYAAPLPVTRAELAYTVSDNADWQQREWESAPAAIDTETRTVTAAIPSGATTAYLNLIDSRDCLVSAPHVEIQQVHRLRYE
ncbi:MAG TPA: prolyl oligopeptidase family serine peptidase [Capsulimonadaceae bacterium]|jgi:dienelactone hydrolase